MYLIKRTEEYEVADSCYFTLNDEEFSADVKGELVVETDKNNEIEYNLTIDSVSVWGVGTEDTKYDPDELSEILMNNQGLIKVSFDTEYPILYIDENELAKKISS